MLTSITKTRSSRSNRRRWFDCVQRDMLLTPMSKCMAWVHMCLCAARDVRGWMRLGTVLQDHEDLTLILLLLRKQAVIRCTCRLLSRQRNHQHPAMYASIGPWCVVLPVPPVGKLDHRRVYCVLNSNGQTRTAAYVRFSDQAPRGCACMASDRRYSCRRRRIIYNWLAAERSFLQSYLKSLSDAPVAACCDGIPAAPGRMGYRKGSFT